MAATTPMPVPVPAHCTSCGLRILPSLPTSTSQTSMQSSNSLQQQPQAFDGEVAVLAQNVHVHAHCLRCDVCGVRLPLMGFLWVGTTLYCPEHYAQTYGRWCVVCHQPTMDILLSYGGRLYHPNCAKCTRCNRVVAIGQRLQRHATELICQSCDAPAIQCLYNRHPVLNAEATLQLKTVGIPGSYFVYRPTDGETEAPEHIYSLAFWATEEAVRHFPILRRDNLWFLLHRQEVAFDKIDQLLWHFTANVLSDGYTLYEPLEFPDKGLDDESSPIDPSPPVSRSPTKNHTPVRRTQRLSIDEIPGVGNIGANNVPVPVKRVPIRRRSSGDLIASALASSSTTNTSLRSIPEEPESVQATPAPPKPAVGSTSPEKKKKLRPRSKSASSTELLVGSASDSTGNSNSTGDDKPKKEKVKKVKSSISSADTDSSEPVKKKKVKKATDTMPETSSSESLPSSVESKPPPKVKKLKKKSSATNVLTTDTASASASTSNDNVNVAPEEGPTRAAGVPNVDSPTSPLATASSSSTSLGPPPLARTTAAATAATVSSVGESPPTAARRFTLERLQSLPLIPSPRASISTPTSTGTGSASSSNSSTLVVNPNRPRDSVVSLSDATSQILADIGLSLANANAVASEPIVHTHERSRSRGSSSASTKQPEVTRRPSWETNNAAAANESTAKPPSNPSSASNTATRALSPAISYVREYRRSMSGEFQEPSSRVMARAMSGEMNRAQVPPSPGTGHLVSPNDSLRKSQLLLRRSGSRSLLVQAPARYVRNGSTEFNSALLSPGKIAVAASTPATTTDGPFSLQLSVLPPSLLAMIIPRQDSVEFPGYDALSTPMIEKALLQTYQITEQPDGEQASVNPLALNDLKRRARQEGVHASSAHDEEEVPLAAPATATPLNAQRRLAPLVPLHSDSSSGSIQSGLSPTRGISRNESAASGEFVGDPARHSPTAPSPVSSPTLTEDQRESRKSWLGRIGRMFSRENSRSSLHGGSDSQLSLQQHQQQLQHHLQQQLQQPEDPAKRVSWSAGMPPPTQQ